jgi:hypothetical protein
VAIPTRAGWWAVDGQAIHPRSLSPRTDLFVDRKIGGEVDVEPAAGNHRGGNTLPVVTRGTQEVGPDARDQHADPLRSAAPS